MTRCRHAVRTSAYRNGCDQFCEGTRWVGRPEPESSSLHCYGFIPDVEDRCPQAAEDRDLNDYDGCPDR